MYSTVALDSRGVVTGAFRAGPPSSGYQQNTQTEGFRYTEDSKTKSRRWW